MRAGVMGPLPHRGDGAPRYVRGGDGAPRYIAIAAGGDDVARQRCAGTEGAALRRSTGVTLLS